jgi:hypothetical protein
VLGLGLTGPPRGSELYGYLHRFLLYAVFLVFLVGLLNDRFRPFRVLAALLGLGLILRLTSGMNLASPKLGQPVGMLRRFSGWILNQLVTR